MHDPAAQPEAHRGGAEPFAERWPAGAHHRRRQAAGGRRALRQSRHLRIPGRRRSHRRRSGVRLHRGQSAPAGRAHRDRGGARHRSREVAARGRRRGDAGLARPGASRHPGAARLCDAASHQHGSDGREGRDQADRRDARGVRSAVRPGRAGRYLWLCGVQDQCGLRLPAGQGHRSCRRPRAGPMWCRKRRAPCANSASPVSTPIFRSSRRCWRIPILSAIASAPVLSIPTSRRWSVRPGRWRGRCSSPARTPRAERRHPPRSAIRPPVRRDRSRCRRRCRAPSSPSRWPKATWFVRDSRSPSSNP